MYVIQCGIYVCLITQQKYYFSYQQGSFVVPSHSTSKPNFVVPIVGQKSMC